MSVNVNSVSDTPPHGVDSPSAHPLNPTAHMNAKILPDVFIVKGSLPHLNFQFLKRKCRRMCYQYYGQQPVITLNVKYP